MSANQSKQNKRINEIKEKWFLTEPLYFMIITTHNTVANEQIKTIRSGDGKIEFNPEFIAKLSDNELDMVLRCELLRIMLKHPYLRRREIAGLSYEASNITIKEYIREAFFSSAQEVFNTSEYNNKYFEFYYEKLIELSEEDSSEEMSDEATDVKNTTDENSDENSDQQQDKGSGNAENDKQKEQDSDEKMQNSEQDGEQDAENSDESTKNDTETDGEELESNEQGAENQEFEDDDGTPENSLNEYTDAKRTGRENTENWNDDELMRNFVNEQIHDAEQSNSWGSISGDIRDEILASCIPKADYKSVLKAFRASVLSQKRRLTRMKPSRRYGFQYMGSRRDFCTKLLFAVDVSGSVSNHDLQVGFSVVNRLFKYGVEEVDVIQFDTEIKGEPMSVKKAVRSIKIMGRGGTYFDPLIDYIDENRQYDGLIVFTDGFAPEPPIPKNRRTRILWLFNNERNYNYMQDRLKSIGKAAFIRS